MEFDIRKNGYGLAYGVLENDETPSSYDPWFHNWRDHSGALSSFGGLVLGGAPGAGKSHITQDVYRGHYVEGSPVAMISCHINSGSISGRSFTETLIKELGDVAGAMLVVDNLDFMVYTGGAKRRRSDKKTCEYAQFMDTLVRRAMANGCCVLATVHSELWRQNHSEAPQDIWDMYEELIMDLGGEKVFRGEIDFYNAVDTLLRRGVPFALARDIAEALEDKERLVFRQAHHIKPDTFVNLGIEEAIKEVNDLRDKKIKGGY
ncbi:MAG: hypothetical protein H6799_00655 [Candidatus Nomurabacteria bacterium]|nr:MAG: hypothetical protein H6799_00655 [Candidatus Nomurabacteria bacterium]HRV75898.1 hypothetical protein [Candidatus Saccharimonadales bacterium]